MKKRYINANYSARRSVQDVEQLEKLRNEEWTGTKYYENRNNGFTYWQVVHLSGPRSFAKESTNNKIRSKYRNAINSGDFEDLYALSSADYQKEFDYYWTIW